MRCQICDKPIDGTPLTLSNLTDPPGTLRVCEACASSERVTVEIDGIAVEVDRDDFIQADKERLANDAGARVLYIGGSTYRKERAIKQVFRKAKMHEKRLEDQELKKIRL